MLKHLLLLSCSVQCELSCEGHLGGAGTGLWNGRRGTDGVSPFVCVLFEDCM